jgi:hypothetical protein
MAKKTYISLTGIQYTFPVNVEVKGKNAVVWVALRGNENSYTTAGKEVQEAIEAHARFKAKEIGLSGDEPKVESSGSVNTKGIEPKEYPDVTDINGAVEILNGEPYKVNKNSLKTPANILAKAEEYNVKFPNLALS